MSDVGDWIGDNWSAATDWVMDEAGEEWGEFWDSFKSGAGEAFMETVQDVGRGIGARLGAFFKSDGSGAYKRRLKPDGTPVGYDMKEVAIIAGAAVVGFVLLSRK